MYADGMRSKATEEILPKDGTPGTTSYTGFAAFAVWPERFQPPHENYLNAHDELDRQ